ncbi:MAG: hypothetical protein COV32_01600 [Candidatus Yonathbacteria bacterium CG10_big_fil_rev_8_21_14_0_10_43_136]|uniref:Uncharacterized protein n=1 Tax=Candidatus Yonathbacteria bacterium CG_4_10_14_0_8_um_filter_43_17 TaxID=1975099 RepID=A0A2M7Q3R0_9BACT|nr:MAG: hypothetical protein COW60_01265 [Candidatus Yonathbacteria bacterium CG17_big_fil_post_rev_8_21_14_2_50_43_9]PIR40762.1 MAG: hypothetical protein COV32_01600 [Candidatus Yonathbacteria bacterium CG10_big_fil_rev_8_21_14_0_10_43_136]PIY58056.1 MAG: hypothetical protein COY98_04095 [Candidatus Yonathbacteria bacterium CG_4_10_14_0_8_um_filter_43_17]PJC22461.1 MAG: hypothetical protein CO060_00390 [Candidatus Yonathbacteria bacterium CG_4_9_14_0_2_um_filter_43_16]
MEPDNHLDEVIVQLKSLNVKLAQQNTIQRILITGVIYGIGFFLGSAIIATIALGVFGPTIAKIPWVQENFDRGSAILRPAQN